MDIYLRIQFTIFFLLFYILCLFAISLPIIFITPVCFLNDLNFKVRKRAKIRNRYNQVPHLTQGTNGKVANTQLDITNESQEPRANLKKFEFKQGNFLQHEKISIPLLLSLFKDALYRLKINQFKHYYM